ncbi:MAG: hypothetical protein R3Y13_02450 [bacterium]
MILLYNSLKVILLFFIGGIFFRIEGNLYIQLLLLFILYKMVNFYSFESFDDEKITLSISPFIKQKKYIYFKDVTYYDTNRDAYNPGIDSYEYNKRFATVTMRLNNKPLPITFRLRYQVMSELFEKVKSHKTEEIVEVNDIAIDMTFQKNNYDISIFLINQSINVFLLILLLFLGMFFYYVPSDMQGVTFSLVDISTALGVVLLSIFFYFLVQLALMSHSIVRIQNNKVFFDSRLINNKDFISLSHVYDVRISRKYLDFLLNKSSVYFVVNTGSFNRRIYLQNSIDSIDAIKIRDDLKFKLNL